MKVCSKCGVLKSLDEYHNNARAKDGKFAKCKPCILVYNSQREKFARSYKQVMVRAARHRAKIGGYPCTIGVNDIDIPTHCPILHIELVMASGRRADNSPSLDKIDPRLGYVPGNVRVISSRANTAKNNLTPEEMDLFCLYHLKERGLL